MRLLVVHVNLAAMQMSWAAWFVRNALQDGTRLLWKVLGVLLVAQAKPKAVKVPLSAVPVHQGCSLTVITKVGALLVLLDTAPKGPCRLEIAASV